MGAVLLVDRARINGGRRDRRLVCGGIRTWSGIALHAFVFRASRGAAAGAALEATTRAFSSATDAARNTQDDRENDEGANDDGDNYGPSAGVLGARQ